MANNIATVSGRGRAGLFAVLYCANVECGSALVGADGQFTVLSTFRNSGTTQLTVTVMDSAGRESDQAFAGQAVILPPPTITFIGPEDRTGVIVGKGAPGASITVYFKATNETAVTTTVSADGTWTVRVSDLPVGSTLFTATQRDAAGISDLMEAGSVVISSAQAQTTNAPTSTSLSTAQVQSSNVPFSTSLTMTKTQSVTQSEVTNRSLLAVLLLY